MHIIYIIKRRSKYQEEKQKKKKHIESGVWKGWVAKVESFLSGHEERRWGWRGPESSDFLSAPGQVSTVDGVPCSKPYPLVLRSQLPFLLGKRLAEGAHAKCSILKN